MEESTIVTVLEIYVLSLVTTLNQLPKTAFASVFRTQVQIRKVPIPHLGCANHHDVNYSILAPRHRRGTQ